MNVNDYSGQATFALFDGEAFQVLRKSSIQIQERIIKVSIKKGYTSIYKPYGNDYINCVVHMTDMWKDISKNSRCLFESHSFSK